MTKVQIAKQSPDKKTLSIPNLAQSSDREGKTYFLLAIALVIGICSAIIGGLLFDRYLKLFSPTQIDKDSHRDLFSAPPATKVQAANLKNVRVLKRDALNTKLDDESMDAVLLFGVIPAPMLPLDRLLPEMYRILKPGGVLAVWPPSWD